MNIWTWLLAALGHSIGWGIRGNFGHETGAMMAGALGTLGAVLLTRRPDWHRRAAVFGVLGAVGWSWGGSISYMQVVAYTHSGHWPSQLCGVLRPGQALASPLRGRGVNWRTCSR